MRLRAPRRATTRAGAPPARRGDRTTAAGRRARTPLPGSTDGAPTRTTRGPAPGPPPHRPAHDPPSGGALPAADRRAARAHRVARGNPRTFGEQEEVTMAVVNEHGEEERSHQGSVLAYRPGINYPHLGEMRVPDAPLTDIQPTGFLGLGTDRQVLA